MLPTKRSRGNTRKESPLPPPKASLTPSADPGAGSQGSSHCLPAATTCQGDTPTGNVLLQRFQKWQTLEVTQPWVLCSFFLSFHSWTHTGPKPESTLFIQEAHLTQMWYRQGGRACVSRPFPGPAILLHKPSQEGALWSCCCFKKNNMWSLLLFVYVCVVVWM